MKIATLAVMLVVSQCAGLLASEEPLTFGSLTDNSAHRAQGRLNGRGSEPLGVGRL